MVKKKKRNLKKNIKTKKAAYNDKLHIHCCRTCDNRVDFAYVEIPYTCKLLFQELTTMNVVPRIMTDK
jgi:DNA-directed RNA polymerase beta subunit